MSDKPFKIEGRPDEESEEADYLVCALATDPTVFTDDLFGFCCECDEKVRFRPHAPKAPKRICVFCLIKVGGLDSSNEHRVTQTALNEIRNYLKKGKQ